MDLVTLHIQYIDGRYSTQWGRIICVSKVEGDAEVVNDRSFQDKMSGPCEEEMSVINLVQQNEWSRKRSLGHHQVVQ